MHGNNVFNPSGPLLHFLSTSNDSKKINSNEGIDESYNNSYYCCYIYIFYGLLEGVKNIGIVKMSIDFTG